MTEKSVLKRVSALRLLSVLSTETKRLIYRELNELIEEDFTTGTWGKVITKQQIKRLNVLERLQKEQADEVEKKKQRAKEEDAQPKPPQDHFLD